MGLDMYLIKKKKEKRRKEQEDLWDFNSDNQLGYWRKANAIHKFFCDNGDEIDEEISYYIDKDVIVDLLDTCKEVLKVADIKRDKVWCGSKWENGKRIDLYEDGDVIANEDMIADLLPTYDGFFYGSTNYDEYYLEKVKETIKILEHALNVVDWDKENVYYLASW